MPFLSFPDGLSSQDFLDQYWQKKPLLMRNALKGYQLPLEPDELGGLACEPDIESRMVIQHGAKDWELRHGPFDEALFASLPDHHWTVLVQDVDKFVPEVAELRQAFAFIPEWRADDIMISYAEDQGSVGPHTDTYDVFLIQAYGRRRWQISCADFTNAALLADLPVRVLDEFQPEQEWVLEPGDVLYLPPGVAHWGLAEGPCMTYSMGYRAPSMQEMLDDFAQYLLERVPESEHYQDKHLRVQTHPSEILPPAFADIASKMTAWLADDRTLKNWFGGFVTQVKPHLAIEPQEDYLSPTELAEMMVSGVWLQRNPFARFAYCSDQRGVILFACGEAFELAASAEQLAIQICEADRIAAPVDADSMTLLARLYNLGYLIIEDE